MNAVDLSKIEMHLQLILLVPHILVINNKNYLLSLSFPHSGKVVEVIGQTKALHLLEETEEKEADGGMLTMVCTFFSLVLIHWLSITCLKLQQF